MRVNKCVIVNTLAYTLGLNALVMQLWILLNILFNDFILLREPNLAILLVEIFVTVIGIILLILKLLKYDYEQIKRGK